MVPAYSVLMCDKGFQIEQECLAGQITCHIPPGKRGMSQLGNVEVAKTSHIAKLRILVEQVIHKVKSFRILSAEIPITFIPQINDILLVCVPIFKD